MMIMLIAMVTVMTADRILVHRFGFHPRSTTTKLVIQSWYEFEAFLAAPTQKRPSCLGRFSVLMINSCHCYLQRPNHVGRTGPFGRQLAPALWVAPTLVVASSSQPFGSPGPLWLPARPSRLGRPDPLLSPARPQTFGSFFGSRVTTIPMSNDACAFPSVCLNKVVLAHACSCKKLSQRNTN